VIVLTVFGLLFVCLKAYFDFHRGDRRNLIRTIRSYAHGIGDRAGPG